VAARFDDEFLAEVLAAKVLPRDVIAELSTLNERLGPQVQAHLSAAYVLLSSDPDEALRHALEARRIAPRLAIVREALGIAYYHAAQYGEAMKELRAARRISGRDDSLPLIADCERALGHPAKALEIARDAVGLDPDTQVEMRIVASGARMDMGQPEAAALTLQTKLLSTDGSARPRRESSTPTRALLPPAGRTRRFCGRARGRGRRDQVTTADRLAEFEGALLNDPIDGVPLTTAMPELVTWAEH
jgi:tetratricopeptide (TPR) repeat protein